MSLLEEQLAYYRARAGEYDQWFHRQGRYDRGSLSNQRWHDEVETVRAALNAFQPSGDALEIACGTGIWTGHLGRHARSVLAVDAAPEMLEISRGRSLGDNVQYLKADVFDWTPPRQFDVVFFAFWLSHVPDDKFRAFWNTVYAALREGGRVFLVDSLPDPESRAKDHPVADESSSRQVRFLNDGRRFEIVKRYYRPDKLAAQLDSLGWTAEIETSGSFFIYGSVTAK